MEGLHLGMFHTVINSYPCPNADNICVASSASSTAEVAQFKRRGATKLMGGRSVGMGGKKGAENWV
ncbi:hypothetical protein U1Q18_000388 [Sarracenia purpurea var. burkii]